MPVVYDRMVSKRKGLETEPSGSVLPVETPKNDRDTRAAACTQS